MEEHIGREHGARVREGPAFRRARLWGVIGLAWLAGVALARPAPMPVGDFGRLPLVFEPADPETGAAFIGSNPGYALALRPTGALLAFHSTPRAKHKGRESRARAAHAGDPVVAVQVRLVGANEDASAEGLERLPTRVNYVLGNDPARWRLGVPTFGQVRFSEVYPGIDVVYYGHQQQLEYDFVVQPGARPETICLEFGGAKEVRVEACGDLVLRVGDRAVRFQKPFAYQDEEGRRCEVASRYAVDETDARRVRFEVGAHDESRPLIIDPVLVYGTYLGGTRIDHAWTVAVDATGSAYVAGETFSRDFPVTTNAFDSTFNSIVSGVDLPKDAFVAKLGPEGTNLVFATYLGGAGDDVALDLALDATGGIWLTGQTYSTNFPTTPDAYSTNISTTSQFGSDYDAFLTHLDPSGSTLIYSTFFGGNQNDGGLSLALDPAGNVLLAGFTESTDFPTKGLATRYNGGISDAFVAKFSPDGQLLYSLYVGGNNQERAESIAVDAAGQPVLAGWTYSGDFPVTNAFQPVFKDGGADAFITKFTADGTSLLFSTYLGGELDDKAFGVALDSETNVYVTGYTLSTAFPTKQALVATNSGGADVFITKLDATGTNLVYSTYFGGTGVEEGWSIAVDQVGGAWIAGRTASTNFPTVDPIQPLFGGGVDDAFVAALSPAGTTLAFSTYLGGSLSDQATALTLDQAGGVYLVGLTLSTNFVELSGLQSLQRQNAGLGDAFVLKLFAGAVRLRAELTSTGDLVLFWPKELTGFELQSTDTLTDFPSWDKVLEAPVVIGNEYAVTLPAVALQRYFRLRR